MCSKATSFKNPSACARKYAMSNLHIAHFLAQDFSHILHRLLWVLCCSHPKGNVICTVKVTYKISSFSNKLVKLPEDV